VSIALEWLPSGSRKAGKVFNFLDCLMIGTRDLSADLYGYSDEIRPFHDNENSAVGALVGGAVRAGFFPLTEYRLRKRSWLDGRSWADGRADLWFVAGDDACSFEFKKTRFLRKRSVESELRDRLYWADRDIKRVPKKEYDYAFSGVIAPLEGVASRADYLKFGRQVDYACVLGSRMTFECFFYFNWK
jgi:hypothetical protein